MVEWLIQIELQLEVICQFSRHYNNVNVRYLWNINACIQIFDNWMDRLECDGLYDEKWLRKTVIYLSGLKTPNFVFFRFYQGNI